MEASERLCTLALAHIEFLRPQEKIALVDMLGGARELFRLGLADFASMLGRRFTTMRWDPNAILRQAEATEKALTGGSIGSIFYWDSQYPPLLREIYDPPAVLFYRGALPDAARTMVGIVGTRYPTGAARKASFRLAFELAREGIGTVSGLARGIDREAHMGCVEGGGFSIAVLGNGIDAVYPQSSKAAALALLEAGGMLASEYPPGEPPRQYHFPARNRLISGLSRSVVVIQAPDHSGALITAEYALEHGRDLFVHGAGIAGTTGMGTQMLADSGATVISGAAGILADWGVAPRMTCSPHPEEPADEDAQAISIASRVRAEIDGSCTTRYGETYWRDS